MWLQLCSRVLEPIHRVPVRLLLVIVEVVHVDQTKLDANTIQLVQRLTYDFGCIRVGQMVRMGELLLKVVDIEGRVVEQRLESEKPLAMSR